MEYHPCKRLEILKGQDLYCQQERDRITLMFLPRVSHFHASGEQVL